MYWLWLLKRLLPHFFNDVQLFHSGHIGKTGGGVGWKVIYLFLWNMYIPKGSIISHHTSSRESSCTSIVVRENTKITNATAVWQSRIRARSFCVFIFNIYSPRLYMLILNCITCRSITMHTRKSITIYTHFYQKLELNWKQSQETLFFRNTQKYYIQFKKKKTYRKPHSVKGS